ncbi:hypothetical protein [Mycobacterium spongiae]|nr:hypothetical protein [Mycobacterium spongiae]
MPTDYDFFAPAKIFLLDRGPETELINLASFAIHAVAKEDPER